MRDVDVDFLLSGRDLDSSPSSPCKSQGDEAVPDEPHNWQLGTGEKPLLAFNNVKLALRLILVPGFIVIGHIS